MWEGSQRKNQPGPEGDHKRGDLRGVLKARPIIESLDDEEQLPKPPPAN